MKTIVTCASIAALGVVGLQAMESYDAAPAKWWSVGANLRGFYDSNYNTASQTPVPGQGASYVGPLSSWGFDFNPYLSLELLRDLTTLRFSLDYDYRWYADRTDNEGDQALTATVSLDHRFSEKLKLEVYDTFAVGSEPALLNPVDGLQSTYARVDGDNLRNYGGIGLLVNFSEKWSSRVSYVNTLYDYQQKGAGSYSALLDRMENAPGVDLRYQLAPDMIGLFGYQFVDVSMTGDEYLASNSPYMSDVRNRQQQIGFLGLDQDVNTKLNYKVRLGGQYVTYPELGQYGLPSDNTVTPYADALLQYKYGERNTAQLGVKYGLASTDVALRFNSSLAKPTLSTEAVTVYGNVVHRILPKLVGTLRGQWQLSQYQDGGFGGDYDNWGSVDLNLTYEINRYVSSEVGYIWDRLDSDIAYRSYTRNRVYFGFRVSY